MVIPDIKLNVNGTFEVFFLKFVLIEMGKVANKMGTFLG